MKFTDGYWHVRPGFEAHYAAEAFEIAVAPDSLTVFATTRPINQRGDTLNAAVITARYSSPLPDVIRVQVTHHKGTAHRGPVFALEPQPPHEVAARVAFTTVRQSSSGPLHAAWASRVVTRWQWQMINAAPWIRKVKGA